MVDWKLVNKLRPHNRNETMKHFIVKAMVFKLYFNNGNFVYSEYDQKRNRKFKVADILARDMKGNKIVVEIESNPIKKHIKELMKFYKKETLYIINLRELSDNLEIMEEQLKYKLGL